MEKNNTSLKEFARRRSQYRLWQRIVSCLCAVSVFVTTYAMILPAITQEAHAYCGKEEHIHSVDAGCYEEERMLICTEEEGEDAHIHTDECYEEQMVFACGLPETEGHAHSDSCYSDEQILICTNSEADHEHGSECYETIRKLTCGQVESEAHTHEESCRKMEKVAVCGQKEGHVHSDECYRVEQKLICEKEEHSHELDCYSNAEADLETAEVWKRTFEGVELSGNWARDVLAIAQTQVGYKESEANYKVENGTKMGYSRYGAWYGVPYGDWCAMFASFVMNYAGVNQDAIPFESGVIRWIEKLEKLELYHETRNGLSEEEKETLLGELRLALIEEKLLAEAGEEAEAIIAALQAEAAEGEEKSILDTLTEEELEAMGRELLPALPAYLPKGGDLIFFDWETDGLADHVGIVYELLDENGNSIDAALKTAREKLAAAQTALEEAGRAAAAAEGGTAAELAGKALEAAQAEVEAARRVLEAAEAMVPAKVRTIEGNSDNRVRYVTYPMNSPRLIGYGELPENPDPDRTVEPVTEPELEPTTHTLMAVTDDGTVITMTALGSSLPFPVHELTLDVSLVENADAKALIESMAATEAESENAALRRHTVLYDIRLMHDGKEVEPIGPVSVSFAGVNMPNDDAQIFHVDPDSETVEEMPVTTDENGDLVMDADHFSIYGITCTYTVDFHFGEHSYSIAGESDILLSSLLERLHIMLEISDITDVTFSDESLVRVVREEDNWRLISLAPFDTEETLTLTLADGSEVVINVTDAVTESTNCARYTINGGSTWSGWMSLRDAFFGMEWNMAPWNSTRAKCIVELRSDTYVTYPIFVMRSCTFRAYSGTTPTITKSFPGNLQIRSSASEMRFGWINVHNDPSNYGVGGLLMSFQNQYRDLYNGGEGKNTGGLRWQWSSGKRMTDGWTISGINFNLNNGSGINFDFEDFSSSAAVYSTKAENNVTITNCNIYNAYTVVDYNIAGPGSQAKPLHISRGNLTINGTSKIYNSSTDKASTDSGAINLENFGNLTLTGSAEMHTGTNMRAMSVENNGWGKVVISGNSKIHDYNGGGIYAHCNVDVTDYAEIYNNQTGGTVYAAYDDSILSRYRQGQAIFADPELSQYAGAYEVYGYPTVNVSGNAKIYNNSQVFTANYNGDLTAGGAIVCSQGSISGNAIIRNNTVKVSNSYSGRDYSVYGGAWYSNHGNVTISGNAQIYGNTVESDGRVVGGAVHCRLYDKFAFKKAVNLAVTISGSAKIYNNNVIKASQIRGGGVHVAAEQAYYSGSNFTFNMNTGAQVYGNQATAISYLYGGGLNIAGNFNSATITGSARIYGNTATTTSSTGYGGVRGGGVCTTVPTYMSGSAAIDGTNKATTSASGQKSLGGGMYAENELYLIGSPVINGNNATDSDYDNLYVTSNQVIRQQGHLTGAAKIGVTVEGNIPATAGTQFGITGPTTSASYTGTYATFFSDTNNKVWANLRSDTKLYWEEAVKLQLHKYSTGYKYLQGAVFRLTDKNGTVTNYTSSGTAYVELPLNYPNSPYTLTEYSAPAGYIKSNVTWRVVVGNDGTVTITDSSGATSGTGWSRTDGTATTRTGTLSVWNNAYGKLVINKYDSTGTTRLPGAVFTLSPSGGDKTTVANAATEYANLAPGTYTLTEKSAPEGYDKSNVTWRVVVGNDGAVTITDNATGALSGTGWSRTNGTATTRTGTLNVNNNATVPAAYKADEDNTDIRLGGAQFKLFDVTNKKWYNGSADPSTWISGEISNPGVTTSANATITSSAASADLGAIYLPSLSESSYALVEVTPPNGYERPIRPFYFTVDASGSSAFTAGTGVVFVSSGTSGLPSDYKRLEYIEGDGAAWIDTGVKLSEGFTELVAQMSVPSDKWATIAAYEASDKRAGFVIFSTSSHKMAYFWSPQGYADPAVSSDIDLTQPFTVTQTNTGITLTDGTNTTSAAYSGSTGIASDATVHILHSDNSNHASYRWGKIYAMQIKKGDTLLRDFIPVQNTATGAVGLWDQVTNTFYGNANGSGAFAAGPEFVDPDSITLLTNHLYTPGKITKVDENGDPLAGAVFSVYKFADDGTTKLWLTGYDGTTQTGTFTATGAKLTYTSGNDGVVPLPPLADQGGVSLYLHEESAPDGYKALAQDVKFVLDRDGISVLGVDWNSTKANDMLSNRPAWEAMRSARLREFGLPETLTELPEAVIKHYEEEAGLNSDGRYHVSPSNQYQWSDSNVWSGNHSKSNGVEWTDIAGGRFRITMLFKSKLSDDPGAVRLKLADNVTVAESDVHVYAFWAMDPNESTPTTALYEKNRYPLSLMRDYGDYYEEITGNVKLQYVPAEHSYYIIFLNNGWQASKYWPQGGVQYDIAVTMDGEMTSGNATTVITESEEWYADSYISSTDSGYVSGKNYWWQYLNSGHTAQQMFRARGNIAGYHDDEYISLYPDKGDKTQSWGYPLLVRPNTGLIIPNEPIPAITKVDENGDPLAGAEFSVYRYPDNDTTGTKEYITAVAADGTATFSASGTPMTWTSEAGTGKIRLPKLTNVNGVQLYLHEEHAPAGYKPRTEDVRFALLDDGLTPIDVDLSAVRVQHGGLKRDGTDLDPYGLFSYEDPHQFIARRVNAGNFASPHITEWTDIQSGAFRLSAVFVQGNQFIPAAMKISLSSDVTVQEADVKVHGYRHDLNSDFQPSVFMQTQSGDDSLYLEDQTGPIYFPEYAEDITAKAKIQYVPEEHAYYIVALNDWNRAPYSVGESGFPRLFYDVVVTMEGHADLAPGEATRLIETVEAFYPTNHYPTNHDEQSLLPYDLLWWPLIPDPAANDAKTIYKSFKMTGNYRGTINGTEIKLADEHGYYPMLLLGLKPVDPIPNEPIGETAPVIYKTDPEGNKITTADALFTLRDGEGKYWNTQTKTWDTVTGTPGEAYQISSDNTGAINLPEGLHGEYTLTETQAPAGYLMPASPAHTLKIQSGELTELDGGKDFTIKNDVPTGDLRIKKTSATGVGLEGAKFKLQNSAGNWLADDSGTRPTFVSGMENGKVLESDANGLLTVERLPMGTYTLVETDPPTGYRIAHESYTVNVAADGTVRVERRSYDSSYYTTGNRINAADNYDRIKATTADNRYNDSVKVLGDADLTDRFQSNVSSSTTAGYERAGAALAEWGRNATPLANFSDVNAYVTGDINSTIADGQLRLVYALNYKTVTAGDPGNLQTFSVKLADNISLDGDSVNSIIVYHRNNANGDIAMDNVGQDMIAKRNPPFTNGKNGDVYQATLLLGDQVTKTYDAATHTVTVTVNSRPGNGPVVIELLATMNGGTANGGWQDVAGVATATFEAGKTIQIPSPKLARKEKVDGVCPTVEVNGEAYAQVFNPKEGELLLEKVDENGEPLAGAGFLLQYQGMGTDSNPLEPYRYQYVQADGTLGPNEHIFMVGDGTNGTVKGVVTVPLSRSYYHADARFELYEGVIPDGYRLTMLQPPMIRLEDDGSLSPNSLTVENRRNKILKVDEKGEPLAGATFSVYRYPNNDTTGTKEYITAVAANGEATFSAAGTPMTWTSGADGEVRLPRLTNVRGVMLYLHEEQPPNGYKPAAEDIRFALADDGVSPLDIDWDEPRELFIWALRSKFTSFHWDNDGRLLRRNSNPLTSFVGYTSPYQWGVNHIQSGNDAKDHIVEWLDILSGAFRIYMPYDGVGAGRENPGAVRLKLDANVTVNPADIRVYAYAPDKNTGYTFVDRYSDLDYLRYHNVDLTDWPRLFPAESEDITGNVKLQYVPAEHSYYIIFLNNWLQDKYMVGQTNLNYDIVVVMEGRMTSGLGTTVITESEEWYPEDYIPYYIQGYVSGKNYWWQYLNSGHTAQQMFSAMGSIPGSPNYDYTSLYPDKGDNPPHSATWGYPALLRMPGDLIIPNEPIAGEDLVIHKVHTGTDKGLNGALFTLSKTEGGKTLYRNTSGEWIERSAAPTATDTDFIYTTANKSGLAPGGTGYSAAEDGYLTIPGLRPGDYTLTELQAPDGYEKTGDGVYQVKVDGSGKIVSVDGKTGYNNDSALKSNKASIDRNDMNQYQWIDFSQISSYLNSGYRAIALNDGGVTVRWVDIENNEFELVWYFRKFAGGQGPNTAIWVDDVLGDDVALLRSDVYFVPYDNVYDLAQFEGNTGVAAFVDHMEESRINQYLAYQNVDTYYMCGPYGEFGNIGSSRPGDYMGISRFEPLDPNETKLTEAISQHGSIDAMWVGRFKIRNGSTVRFEFGFESVQMADGMLIGSSAAGAETYLMKSKSFTIPNSPEASGVRKVDAAATGNGLSGAEFYIQNLNEKLSDGSTANPDYQKWFAGFEAGGTRPRWISDTAPEIIPQDAEKITSGTGGSVDLPGLPAGKYLLQEKLAPTDYSPEGSGAYWIIVGTDGTVTLTTVGSGSAAAASFDSAFYNATSVRVNKYTTDNDSSYWGNMRATLGSNNQGTSWTQIDEAYKKDPIQTNVVRATDSSYQRSAIAMAEWGRNATSVSGFSDVGTYVNGPVVSKIAEGKLRLVYVLNYNSASDMGDLSTLTVPLADNITLESGSADDDVIVYHRGNGSSAGGNLTLDNWGNSVMYAYRNPPFTNGTVNGGAYQATLMTGDQVTRSYSSNTVTVQINSRPGSGPVVVEILAKMDGASSSDAVTADGGWQNVTKANATAVYTGGRSLSIPSPQLSRRMTSGDGSVELDKDANGNYLLKNRKNDGPVIYKVDANDQSITLSGALFELRGPSPANTLIGTVKSDSEGKITLPGNLAPATGTATYQLIETQAPPNTADPTKPYVLDSTPHNVVIDASGKIVSVDGKKFTTVTYSAENSTKIADSFQETPWIVVGSSLRSTYTPGLGENQMRFNIDTYNSNAIAPAYVLLMAEGVTLLPETVQFSAVYTDKFDYRVDKVGNQDALFVYRDSTSQGQRSPYHTGFDFEVIVTDDFAGSGGVVTLYAAVIDHGMDSFAELPWSSYDTAGVAQDAAGYISSGPYTMHGQSVPVLSRDVIVASSSSSSSSRFTITNATETPQDNDLTVTKTLLGSDLGRQSALVTAAGGAKVYAKPDAAATETGTAAANTTVTVLGRYTDGAGTEWYQVKAGTETGWLKAGDVQSTFTQFFTFEITVTDETGTAVALGELPGAAVNGNKATVELAPTGRLTIPGLPANAKVSIREVNHHGFRVLFKEENSNITWTTETTLQNLIMNQAHSIEVVNNPGIELPHTGGAGTHIWTYGGLTLMAMAALMSLIPRRRERERRLMGQ